MKRIPILALNGCVPYGNRLQILGKKKPRKRGFFRTVFCGVELLHAQLSTSQEA
jgi:hypothetical protein